MKKEYIEKTGVEEKWKDNDKKVVGWKKILNTKLIIVM